MSRARTSKIVGEFENVRNIAPDFALEGISERLRLAREHAGLSQEEFASAVGFSRRQVIAWERGQNAPPVVIFARLRNVCGVDPEWVLSGPGLEPLEDVTPEDRERDKRVVRRIDKMAKSFGLELPDEALDDLARIVLREPEHLEEEAIVGMRAYLRPLAMGKR